MRNGVLVEEDKMPDIIFVADNVPASDPPKEDSEKEEDFPAIRIFVDRLVAAS